MLSTSAIDSHHAKIENDRPIGGVVAYAWNITLAWFLARDVIGLYTSRAYATMSVSVCLSICDGSELAHS